MNKEKVIEILETDFGWRNIEQRDELVIEMMQDTIEATKKAFSLTDVVNCVYVVTERDNYGEQLFRGVFANKEKAIEYLAEDGLEESNIDEINEIELD